MTKDLVALWATFEQNLVLVLGVILFAGALLGRAVEFVRLPQITGYILAGLILGPHGIGLVDTRLVWPLHVLTIVALATIAFHIGSEFDRAKLRRTGVAVCTLAAAQLVGSFLLVLGVMLAIGLAWQNVLLLAALATSTAPVTTYTVIHSIRASGRAVDYVYGILALNDASVILIFGFVSSIAASALTRDGSAPGALAAVLPALGNEVLSIAYGAASGVAVAFALHFMHRDPMVNDVRVKVSFIGMALVFVGVALALGLSHLLAPLALGVTMANTMPAATINRLKELLRPFTDPLFLVFLVLAGAHLRADILGHPLTTLIAVCYVVFRLAGKYAGIAGAATFLELPKSMVASLGLCFASQGGLVIGMLLTFANAPAIAALPADQSVEVHRVVSAVLIAVLISQLFGPAVIRYALRRTASQHDRQ
jgi:Kef-type K+ transport system membrane component KefB